MSEFKTSCGKCGKEIILQKDSTEGMSVYHGDCWRQLNKKVGEK